MTIRLHNDQVSAHFSRTSNYRLNELTVADLEIGEICMLWRESSPDVQAGDSWIDDLERSAIADPAAQAPIIISAAHGDLRP